MSAEVFMRLTPRFSAGYMEIREVQDCVFASFSLGWSASNVEEWRSETTLTPFSCAGVWVWRTFGCWRLNATAGIQSQFFFGEMRHYFQVLFSFQNLESDSLLIDSLSELFCFSSFVLGFVFTAPDNELELAKHQPCCLKLQRLPNRSLTKMSLEILALVCTDPTLNSTFTFKFLH